MHTEDVIIPLLGGLLVLTSFVYSAKDGIKTQRIIEFIIGVAIMAFAIWYNDKNTDEKNTLISNVTKLLEQRKSDSINNSSFQKDLKDSFKIVRNSLTNKPEKLTITNNQYNTSRPKDLVPTLNIVDILNDKPNPNFTITGSDMRFSVIVEPVGSSIGHILSKQITFIGQRNGKPDSWKQFYSTALRSNDLIYNPINFIFIEHITIPKNLPDTILVGVEVKYTNEANIIKKYIRKIYYVPILDQGKHLTEVEDNKFIELSNYLLKNKAWSN